MLRFRTFGISLSPVTPPFGTPKVFLPSPAPAADQFDVGQPTGIPGATTSANLGSHRFGGVVRPAPAPVQDEGGDDADDDAVITLRDEDGVPCANPNDEVFAEADKNLSKLERSLQSEDLSQSDITSSLAEAGVWVYKLCGYLEFNIESQANQLYNRACELHQHFAQRHQQQLAKPQPRMGGVGKVPQESRARDTLTKGQVLQIPVFGQDNSGVLSFSPFCFQGSNLTLPSLLVPPALKREDPKYTDDNETNRLQAAQVRNKYLWKLQERLQINAHTQNFADLAHSSYQDVQVRLRSCTDPNQVFKILDFEIQNLQRVINTLESSQIYYGVDQTTGAARYIYASKIRAWAVQAKGLLEGEKSITTRQKRAASRPVVERFANTVALQAATEQAAKAGPDPKQGHFPAFTSQAFTSGDLAWQLIERAIGNFLLGQKPVNTEFAKFIANQAQKKADNFVGYIQKTIEQLTELNLWLQDSANHPKTEDSRYGLFIWLRDNVPGTVAVLRTIIRSI